MGVYTSIGNHHFVHACLSSGVWMLSIIQEQQMYYVYGVSVGIIIIHYIHLLLAHHKMQGIHACIMGQWVL